MPARTDHFLQEVLTKTLMMEQTAAAART